MCKRELKLEWVEGTETLHQEVNGKAEFTLKYVMRL